jgi:coenzyme A diphosphatase NUDT7
VRSKSLRSHAGEVCLPGGKRDVDVVEDEVATAVREANEEIGLNMSDIEEILGTLNPSASRVGIIVTPVVALIKSSFKPVINEDEVSRVFQVPVDIFKSNEYHSFIDYDYHLPPMQTAVTHLPRKNDFIFRLHQFDYKGYKIWGLTAQLLIDFAVVFFNVKHIHLPFDFLPENSPSYLDIAQWTIDRHIELNTDRQKL